MRAPVPIALLTMGLAAACGDGEPLDPPVIPAPVFAMAGCELGVSTEEALAAIADLIAQVNALEVAGSLNAGQARALRNHLTNAQRALLEGRACAAQAQLRAFRTQVGDFEDAGVLAGDEAAPLLDAVEDLLEGPPTIVPGSITTGLQTSCGLTASGRAYCWGANQQGSLGDGTTTDRSTPTAVAGDMIFTSIDAGAHTCGVAGGVAYCWGPNGFGELGDGTGVDRLVPTAVAGGLELDAIAAGIFHTCALTTGGAAYCWGSNLGGRLGNGSAGGMELAPVAVVDGLVFTAISAGFNHTCALTPTGDAYCWGNNDDGQLGLGVADTFRSTPTAVSGGHSFWAISVGSRFTCGLATTGTAYCWGFNDFGQLGDGTLEVRLAPVPVSGGLVFEAISAGNLYSCAITPDQAVYCWGDNSAGQLGNPAVIGGSTTPVPVVGDLTIRLASAGQGHACALTPGGIAYCWGNNFFGEVGDGTNLNVRFEPTEVLGWSTLP